MNALLFIAQRFIMNTREKTLRTMLIITLTSIAIGSCALALVMAVMHGFEQKTRATIQGIHPDLMISTANTNEDYHGLMAKLKRTCGSSISGMSPYVYHHGMIKAPDSEKH